MCAMFGSQLHGERAARRGAGTISAPRCIFASDALVTVISRRERRNEAVAEILLNT